MDIVELTESEVNYLKEDQDINKNIKKIEITMPTLEQGEAKKIVNVNGNYVLSDISEDDDNGLFTQGIHQATYDIQRMNHIYSKVIEDDYAKYITTPEELTVLAQNTQNDIEKIIKINGIVKYYINKDDLIGKVVEIVENNVNTNYSINYPTSHSIKKKERKMFEELKKVIENFNKQINIPQLIIDNLRTTYTEGNHIYYLMGNTDRGFSIVNYPLKIVEITPMKIDGEPVVSFSIQELRNKLQKTLNKYGKLKANKSIELTKTIEEEIKRDYPVEVYEAYKAKDRYSFLNPERVGVTRINNFKGLYGLTPIFKSLSSQLMLETFDVVDRKNVVAKSKKIYFQTLRKEMLGQDGSKLKHANEVGYAQASLLKTLGNDIIVYTAMPYVEDLRILEPKTNETDPKTILAYRNRVLNALGIGYLSNESKSSFNTVNVNVDELLKTVNKITKELENVINKYYKLICKEYGFPIEYAPSITIESTEYLDFDTKCKLIELLYSKIGVSYQTIFEKLGMNSTEEYRKRREENEFMVDGEKVSWDETFSPHPTSFVISGKDNNKVKNDGKDTNNNGSEKNNDIDKNQYDKEVKENQK